MQFLCYFSLSVVIGTPKHMLLFACAILCYQSNMLIDAADGSGLRRSLMRDVHEHVSLPSRQETLQKHHAETSDLQAHSRSLVFVHLIGQSNTFLF